MYIPDEVAVIGGGNTAIDAAVTAKRFGSKDVYIIYRRTFSEIPAWPKERELAMNIGVNFLILTQPLDYISDNNGNLTGIKVVRTKLSPTLDQSGRRKPVIIPNTEHVIDCDLAIEAIGQKIAKETLAGLDDIQLNDSGLIKLKYNSFETTQTGVFAGGDIVNGGDTVVRAIGDGVKAASEIGKFLDK
jgi:glutamate synthase (NADPH/NADH) small chain